MATILGEEPVAEAEELAESVEEAVDEIAKILLKKPLKSC